MPSKNESKQAEDIKRGSIGCLTIFLVFCLVGSCLFGGSKKLPPLSQNQKEMIISDLTSANYPLPKTIEVNKETGFVVVTFEVLPHQIPDGGEAFATDALLKVREQLLPSGIYKSFRVTLNAPLSNYTGIITRYGSARFTEDLGKVIWRQRE